jgi:hypothetical protein
MHRGLFQSGIMYDRAVQGNGVHRGLFHSAVQNMLRSSGVFLPGQCSERQTASVVDGGWVQMSRCRMFA